MNRLYILLGVLAMIGTLTTTAYLKGRSDGRWAERRAQLRVIAKLNEQLSERTQELADLESARLRQVKKLEDQVLELMEAAREDPHANRPALGVGSVQRLNAIVPDRP